MSKPRIIRLAESWTPDPDDPLGEDKRRLIRFLLDNEVRASNAKTIDWILRHCHFGRTYTRQEFQQLLVGPLRRDPRVFIGWAGAGLFLVTSPEDADVALASYTGRVRAELHHVRQLRKLARRTRLMDGYVSAIPAGKERATIYLDESGTPDLADLDPPLFVVAAVVIETRHEVAELERRFKNALEAIRRPANKELKASSLSVHNHRKALRELSLVDYQWAAAAFDKTKLHGGGFVDPVTFYRYAFQSLVGDLLMIAWRADLIIDQNSTPQMQAAFESYLRRQNSGLPVKRLGEVTFADSAKERLVQLADLVAGAVRRSVEGHRQPLREIEDKMINLQFWPPR